MSSADALRRLLATAAKAQAALSAAEDGWLAELDLTSGKLRLLEALSAAGGTRTAPQLARSRGNDAKCGILIALATARFLLRS